MRGDDNWMLPSVAQRIDEINDSVEEGNDIKKKKKKKDKKHKKQKKYKKRKLQSDESSSDELLMQKKKKKKHERNKSSSNNSDDSETEWIEKTNIQSKDNSQSLVRDDWMSGMLIPTFSKPDQQTKKVDNNINLYDPSKSNRELNPYWRDGGVGLPAFKKPLEYETNSTQMELNKSNIRGNWRKTKDSADDTKILENEKKFRSPNTLRKQSKSPDRRNSRSLSPLSPKHKSKSRKKYRSSSSESSSDENKITSKKITEKSYENAFLTDQQMNEMGAKLIKAEILGNTALATELQEKLENARNYRKSHKIDLLNKQHVHKQIKQPDEEHILLTTTNSKGISRPLQQHHRSHQQTSDDRWGGRKKGKKVETHVSGDRVRYFADDDKYDIKQMVINKFYIIIYKKYIYF